jgi:hypothetical protein
MPGRAMSDIFLIPLIAGALAMLFSHRCMSGTDFPFAGLFSFVVGMSAFATIFLLVLIYTVIKAVLP